MIIFQDTPNLLARQARTLIAMAVVSRAVELIVLLLGSATKSKGPADADFSALAQDAHMFSVACRSPCHSSPCQIRYPWARILPWIVVARAVWPKRKDEFYAVASDPSSAAVLDLIKVRVQTYGWNGSNAFRWKKFAFSWRGTGATSASGKQFPSL